MAFTTPQPKSLQLQLQQCSKTYHTTNSSTGSGHNTPCKLLWWSTIGLPQRFNNGYSVTAMGNSKLYKSKECIGHGTFASVYRYY